MKPDEFDPERQKREDDLEQKITAETSSINKYSIPLSDGRFVTSLDYEKLLAENKRLQKALAALLFSIPPCDCIDAYKSRDRLDPDCTYHRIAGWTSIVEDARKALKEEG